MLLFTKHNDPEGIENDVDIPSETSTNHNEESINLTISNLEK